MVPIHSALRPALERLLGDRRDGFLLAGLTATKYGDRSNGIGQRFTQLKRMHGFRREIVFHSIRKTVATMLENAEVPENAAADILGHEKPRITYGLYSGGTSLALKQEAIEKPNYPD
jgi:integrase